MSNLSDIFLDFLQNKVHNLAEEDTERMQPIFQYSLGLVASLFTTVCVAQSPPANNGCANAAEIYLGTTPFSTVDATTDGQSHPECSFDGQTYYDVWYTFTAGCSGTLVVSTCNTADYDSDLVVYFG